MGPFDGFEADHRYRALRGNHERMKVHVRAAIAAFCIALSSANRDAPCNAVVLPAMICNTLSAT